MFSSLNSELTIHFLSLNLDFILSLELYLTFSSSLDLNLDVNFLILDLQRD